MQTSSLECAWELWEHFAYVQLIPSSAAWLPPCTWALVWGGLGVWQGPSVYSLGLPSPTPASGGRGEACQSSSSALLELSLQVECVSYLGQWGGQLIAGQELKAWRLGFMPGPFTVTPVTLQLMHLQNHSQYVHCKKVLERAV